jgi:polar amino acid transport system substrate-binding protein
LAMLSGMILFSLILLLFERRYEKGHFGGSTLRGFGSALWFSAVTMTTVGYGDKTPNSALGRVITFFWMLVGVLLIAIFTGTVASSITMEEMKHGVVHFQELSHFRTGYFEASRMSMLLKERGIPGTSYAAPELGLEAMKRGEINAFAGDSISLEYMMTHHAPGRFRISMVPNAALFYSFATRPDFPLLPKINRCLLEITLAPDWRQRVERWTGPLSFF